jgi:hypothetical protein
MNTRIVYPLSAGLPAACLFIFAATLQAQSVPGPAAGAASADEVLQLSPFEIREAAEDKWSASSTLLGNRTNQELVRVPATVDVLTRDFMNDIGVFSMDDAAAFVSGLTVTPRLEARNDDSRITFRGLSGSSNTSRNFFQWQVPSDTYNVERFDFGKGSNSLMFGDSTPGGQVTTTTKRARFVNATELLANYDSFGSYRVQLDVNRKVSKQLALRLNFVNRSDQSWVHDSYQSFRGLDLAVTYRPFKNTTISLDAERGLYTRQRADNTAQILPIAAPGRSFGTNNSWYYTTDGETIPRPNVAGYPALATVDTTGASGNSVSLLEGQSAGVLLPDGTQKIFHGFSRSFNILGFGDHLDRPFNVVTAMVDQNIGKLSIQASYNQQFQHQDRNDNAFGGSGSPPVIRVDGSGRPYLEMTGGLTTYKRFGDTLKAGRLSAAYPFDFGKWMKQSLVLTGTRSKDYINNRRFGLANAAAPGLVANNTLLFRAYLDDPDKLVAGGWNRVLPVNLPHTPTFDPQLTESYVNTGPFINVRYTRNYTASLSGEYFGGRLTSLVGMSYNHISRKIPIAAAYNTDATGRITFWGTPDSAPQFFTYDPSFDLSARSWIYGLTYTLLKKENVSVNTYAVYTQSFNWQSQQTFTGQNLGPITGTTKEVGLKGDLWRGKIFYTLAGYEIARQSAGYAWTPNSLTSVQLEDLFNPNSLLPSDPTYFHVTTGLNSESRTVSSTEKSKGVELTVSGQRIHGIQGRLTFSKTQVEATRDFSDFQHLLEAAIARTAAANAPGGDRTQAESASLISTAQSIEASNTNTTVVTGLRSAPYTASAVLDYQFRQLDNLRLGVSAVWTPDYNVAIFNGVTYRGGAACPIGAYATYDRKIFGQRTSLRIGVNRVYDLAQGASKYYKSGANSFNTALNQPNYIYRYTEPLKANLSAVVRF